jgi:hypothetical protein
MKKAWVLLLVGFCIAPPGWAGTVPFGPQNDVPLNTVVDDWGWSVVYRGDYRDTVSFDTMFGGATGSYVMLAGIQDGSNTIDVLAAALKTDVLMYTPGNTPHIANGSEWYCNGDSMGFAGLGDTIFQSSADAWDVFSGSPWERDRLSWHTYDSGGSGFVATVVNGGWRSGTNIGLNFNTDWDRLVLTYEPVPLPGAFLLGAIGLGVAQWRLRKRA